MFLHKKIHSSSVLASLPNYSWHSNMMPFFADVLTLSPSLLDFSYFPIKILGVNKRNIYLQNMFRAKTYEYLASKYYNLLQIVQFQANSGAKTKVTNKP